MTRLRETYKLKEVVLSEIKPEIVPLAYEKSLKNSLYENQDKQEQVEEIRLIEISENGYKYRYLNGRRRGETIRSIDGNEGKVRAIIVPFQDEETLHLQALISNAGKPNYPDEAEHSAYLRDACGYQIKEIAKKTGLTYSVVHNRLFIYDNLIPSLFEMFKVGRFNFSSAWKIAKLTIDQQNDLIRLIDKENIKSKDISDFCNDCRTKEINKLFDTFDQKEEKNDYVVLSSEQMEKIMADESILIEYKGKEIQICRCDW